MRLFLALWPPTEVLDQLASLPRPDTTGIRWTTRDQWHLTLRFLGEVDLRAGELALESLAGFPARDITLGPATERLGRANLVVRAVGADDLGTALDPDREFIGHLTLARSRRKHIPEELLGTPVRASWTARSVCLVRSTLAPSGAIYEDVASIPLEGA